ncbi:MAG: hypothetical protein K0R15_2050 [Clostridiales bacterium]|jgi:hypothetical protein|nr:hypothetical protein [Clostridiales bacterium]
MKGALNLYRNDFDHKNTTPKSDLIGKLNLINDFDNSGIEIPNQVSDNPSFPEDVIEKKPKKGV